MPMNEIAADDRPAYRFRWSNIDLERYIDGRIEAAQGLRRGVA
jgi:hypothetical protein